MPHSMTAANIENNFFILLFQIISFLNSCRVFGIVVVTVPQNHKDYQGFSG